MNRATPTVVQTSSYEEIHELQSDAIRAPAGRLGRRLSILEAGCGQRWRLDLTGVDFTLTGVDLDPEALEMRQTKMRDLDVSIVGDLCCLELPGGSFDVVYSAFVLEHVQRADVALENFIRWLRPGGLLILRLPERKSARALLTRMLPDRAHVWYYRYVYGKKQAGQPGHAPYPTYHHSVTGQEFLCRFLGDRGVKCLNIYGDGFVREGEGLTGLAIRGMLRTVSLLSLGTLTAEYKDALYIAAKDDGGVLPIVGRVCSQASELARPRV